MFDSLETLQEQEYYALDEIPLTGGVDPMTPTDRYMEVSYAGLVTDSEESEMRENRTDTMLRERPLHEYHPFSGGVS